MFRQTSPPPPLKRRGERFKRTPDSHAFAQETAGIQLILSPLLTRIFAAHAHHTSLRALTALVLSCLPCLGSARPKKERHSGGHSTPTLERGRLRELTRIATPPTRTSPRRPRISRSKSNPPFSRHGSALPDHITAHCQKRCWEAPDSLALKRERLRGPPISSPAISKPSAPSLTHPAHPLDSKTP